MAESGVWISPPLQTWLHDRREQKNHVVALCMAAVTVSVLSGCTGNSTPDGLYRYKQSTPLGTVIPVDRRAQAGAMSGSLLDGGAQYQLSQDAGNVVVLSYFASWCGPCQTEAPEMDALYRQRKASGVKFVGVNTKDPSKSSASSWIAEKKLSFPIIYDPPAKTALEIGSIPITLPGTIVIDKHGRVAAVYLGRLQPDDLTPDLDVLAKEA
ncbi:TlpA disulfide reductase family protein [Jatrophihabitans sp. DSM 45814]